MNSNIVYNINGENARVNNNSLDKSTNIINNNPDVAKHISMLRHEIKSFINSREQQKEALEMVGAIEDQFESKTGSKAVLSSLIKALPNAGSIASIGSFLLSCIGGK